MAANETPAALDEQFLHDLEDLEGDEQNTLNTNAYQDVESPEQSAAHDVQQPTEPEEAVRIARSSRLNETLSHVDEYSFEQASSEAAANDDAGAMQALDVDSPVYKLIVACNELVVDIDAELADVHNFVKDRYRKKFPELESLVQHPVDYARVVKSIGNEMDLTKARLDGILPSATIMVVTVTGSTTAGNKLSDVELDRCLRACDIALELDESKNKLLHFIEKQMARIAPNLCAITGSEIAAKLMATAGGLHALAKTPGCNIQVLGAKKKHLAGFSARTAQQTGDLHAGYLFNIQLIQHEVPPTLRKKALRMVAGKVALMARKDAFGEDPEGSSGQNLLQEMRNKVEKWQEPTPARIVQPMKRPEDNKRTRRGGKRKRKQKEMLEMTEVRKQANRVGFNQPEEDVGQEEIGEGLGQLGSEGGMSGKVRASAQKSKALQRAAKQTQNRRGIATQTSSGATQSGTASSLSFTPVQGIELANPNQKSQTLGSGEGTDSVFNEKRGFQKVNKVARDLKR